MGEQRRLEGITSAGAGTGDERDSAGYASELPAPPLAHPLHASPLYVPPSEDEPRARQRIPFLIVGNAAVVSAGIIAAALIVRSERDRAGEPPEAESRNIESPASAAPTDRRLIAPTAKEPSSPPPRARSTEEEVTAHVATNDLHAQPISRRASEPRARSALAARRARDVGVRSAARASPRTGASLRAASPWLVTQPRGHRFPRTPYRPSRAQVLHAMHRVAPAVYACFERGRGFAMVRVSVAGSSGRVKSARVLRQAGPQVPCITRAVRRARFPKFLKQTLQVDFPFKR